MSLFAELPLGSVLVEARLGPFHANSGPPEAATNYELLYSSKQATQGQSQAASEPTHLMGGFRPYQHDPVRSTGSTPNGGSHQAPDPAG